MYLKIVINLKNHYKKFNHISQVPQTQGKAYRSLDFFDLLSDTNVVKISP
jgi:hypothetical protein